MEEIWVKLLRSRSLEALLGRNTVKVVAHSFGRRWFLKREICQVSAHRVCWRQRLDEM